MPKHKTQHATKHAKRIAQPTAAAASPVHDLFLTASIAGI